MYLLPYFYYKVVTLVAYTLKNPPVNADLGWIPGSGRSPREGNGNPLQYSCLENPMDRGRSLCPLSSGGLQSIGWQKVRYDWMTNIFTFIMRLWALSSFKFPYYSKGSEVWTRYILKFKFYQLIKTYSLFLAFPMEPIYSISLIQNH